MTRTLEMWRQEASVSCGPSDYAERVALKAYETDSCLWHASYLLACEDIAAGVRGRACFICGGTVEQATWPDHSRCIVRKRRGQPTPRIDQAPQCGCAKCRPDVRRMV